MVFMNDNETINQFLANVPILYPLKKPENRKFSGVFSGDKIVTLARNGSTFWGIKAFIQASKYRFN